MSSLLEQLVLVAEEVIDLVSTVATTIVSTPILLMTTGVLLL